MAVSFSGFKKEKKAYFYDWTRAASEASRFENYAALSLKASSITGRLLDMANSIFSISVIEMDVSQTF